jgi:ABC-2 type transport system permease protein
MVVGAAVAFAIARIIVKKSPRILNRETGVQFGAFALVALLLFLGLRFDLYGYERRVPSAGGVESVTVMPVPGDNRIIQPSAYSNTGFYTFSDAESIEAVTALHRGVVENRTALRHMEPRVPYSGMSLRYETSNGTSVNRRWSLPTDFFIYNEDMRALLESNEFREQNSFKNPKLGAITSISLSGRGDMSGRSDGTYIVLSSDEFAGITAALDEDLRRQTYEQLFDLTMPIATIDVWFAAPQGEATGDSVRPAAQAERWLSLAVPKSFENTIAWLSERGYYDRLTAWRESVESIQLSRYTDSPAPNGFGYITHDEEIAVFDDPELIEAVLEMGESTPDNYDEYYAVNLNVLRARDDFSQEYGGMDFVYLNKGNPALDMLLAAAAKGD